MLKVTPPKQILEPFAKIFDRTALRTALDVQAVRVATAALKNFQETNKSFILAIPRYKSILPDSSDTKNRLVLLKEANKDSFSYELVLDYSYWNVEEVLDVLLPEDVSRPTSFEIVGHLIHLNLLPEHEPYKYVIAQVILDKNAPQVRTVVNKVGSIETRFRTFEMEVLAGEDDTVVRVREQGCTFEFDYRKVYWNSRLGHEHERLVKGFEKGDVVVDAFAGVGPFAIPAAKKGCIVYANDLNPESHAALTKNCTLNKVKMQTFCLDARDFIKKMQQELPHIDHVLMNLPASSHQFLDSVIEFSEDTKFHSYVFAKTFTEGRGIQEHIQAGEARARQLIIDSCSRAVDIVHIQHVRNVSPNKDMYCVSFRLASEKNTKRTKLFSE